MNIVQPRERNDKLLEFLTRRSVADFQKFINVLAEEQVHLVRLLVTDGGETFWKGLNMIFLVDLTSQLTDMFVYNMLFNLHRIAYWQFV